MEGDPDRVCLGRSGQPRPQREQPKKNEDQPFLSSNGQEMWFSGDCRLGYPGPSTFRSLLQPDGSWGPAQEIVSRFAGEPTLDDAGNLYFVHYFFSRDGKMIEADIYLALRK